MLQLSDYMLASFYSQIVPTDAIHLVKHFSEYISCAKYAATRSRLVYKSMATRFFFSRSEVREFVTSIVVKCKDTLTSKTFESSKV